MSGIPPPPPGFQPNFVQNQLPPGWTEHQAPGGQLYWYNQQSKISTYTRPIISQVPPPPPAGFAGIPPPPVGFTAPANTQPPAQFAAPIHFSLTSSNPPVLQPPSQALPVPKEKKEKKEKPLTKTPIEGTEWTRVITTKGNTFYTNRETKESVWTVPGEIRELLDALERSEKVEVEEVKIEIETGTGAKRKASGELEEEVKVAGEEVKIEIEEEVKTAAEPPAKRKRGHKPKLVHSIADLGQNELNEIKAATDLAKVEASTAIAEQDDVPDDSDANEEWQRELLNQMAKEEGAKESISPVPIKSRLPPSLPAIPLPQVSPEEAVAGFKAMLKEKDISPMAPWDNELPKFVEDPRYLAVKTLNERRDLFDGYCKELIRSNRAAKKAALEAGGGKVDPLTSYRALLSVAVTSTRTHFSDFKRSHSKDPRFRDFGNTEGEKEKVFKSWLRELGERKRGEAKLGEERFSQMLREDQRIAAGDKWLDVKTQFVSDPRYDAVPSSSLRESLFNAHLVSLASSSASSSASAALSKVEKAAKASVSLREREEKVRIEKERSSRNANAARGAMGREEGEREFVSLLIDAVRDHDAQWNAVAPGLERDPRFQTISISIHDKRRLFESHLTSLYNKRLAVLEVELFASHAPLLITPFTDVLPSISTSPHVTRLVDADFDKLEGLYNAWVKKKVIQARRDFDVLLSESPILEHWGRLKQDKKSGKGEEIKGGLEDDEDEEGGDDAIDIKSMAAQVDLTAVQAVLKHDKRFLIFNHVPEDRVKWIEEFMTNLAAPDLTVHSRTQ